MTRTARPSLAAIWALYVVPRVLVLLVPVAPTSDAQWYVQRARELAAGLGYIGNDGEPTAFWPAGWPMALSVLFRLTGPSVPAIGLFNLVAAILAGWLTLLLGRRLFGNETGARLGLLLLAVYPNAIAYVPLALTEVFYTALLLLGCWLVVARRSEWWLVGAGLVFGLASLVKAQTLVVVVLLFAIEWLREPGLWQRLPKVAARGVLVMACAGLVLTPWAARNHAQLGRWVAVSTNGGFNLLIGNSADANGGYAEDGRAFTALMARADLDEVARDAEARRLALDWIADNPWPFLALVPRKLALLWLPDGEAEWAYQAGAPSYAAHETLYRAVRLANQAYYAALMLGFAASFVVLTHRRRTQGQRWVGWWLLPWGVAAYPTLVAVLIFGQSRFHFPAMPFVCLACGWLLADVLDRRALSPADSVPQEDRFDREPEHVAQLERER